MKTALDILNMEGVVVRKIPTTSVSLFAYRVGDEDTLKENERIVTRKDRQFREVTTKNSLGGKYILTFVQGQGSGVRFDIKRDGVGDTIEEAYADYLKKNHS